MTLLHGDAMSDETNVELRGAAPFDLITCSSALIYLPSVPAALRRFACWLAPGGRLAVNSPLVRPCTLPNPAFHVSTHFLMQPNPCRLQDVMTSFVALIPRRGPCEKVS